MATNHSHRGTSELPPAFKVSSPTVLPHGRDKAADLIPFPVNARPYLAPHRMAGATADPEMAEAIRQRLGERRDVDLVELSTDPDAQFADWLNKLGGKFARAAIVIGFTTLGVCVLFYLATGFIRSAFQ